MLIVGMIAVAALLVALGWAGMAVWRACRPGRARWLGPLGALLAMWGVGALACGGAAAKWPLSVEYPVGWTANIAELGNGRRAVAVEAIGRVQIYDRNGSFLKAVPVENDGGSMEIAAVEATADQFRVQAARTRVSLVLNDAGEVVSRHQFVDFERSMTVFDNFARSVWVPTSWVFVPIAQPFIAVVLIIIGVGGLAVGNARRTAGRKIAA